MNICLDTGTGSACFEMCGRKKRDHDHNHHIASSSHHLIITHLIGIQIAQRNATHNRAEKRAPERFRREICAQILHGKQHTSQGGAKGHADTAGAGSGYQLAFARLAEKKRRNGEETGDNKKRIKRFFKDEDAD